MWPITDKRMRPLNGDHHMTLVGLQFKQRHSFLEYVFGGCEIGLAIAIDFTGSNGNPAKRNSLHYYGDPDMRSNEYLQAIQSVGNILQYYDSDKQIPVLGYGAKIPGHDHTSHCFALNGNSFDPEVDGLAGVVDAYKKTIKTVGLGGPTNFAPIMSTINEMTEDMQCS
jgi:hypothetical protein